MRQPVRFEDSAVDRLVDYAALWTGFSRDAILPDAIRRAAGSLLRHAESPEEVLSRAAHHDREVVHALCQAVSVGETFFFRHPEHFLWVASTFLPGLRKERREAIRAWSAGCATGEEAYSIAACLLDLAPPSDRMAIEVLGTDLLERNLAVARSANYGLWSRRPSGPLLHPVFRGDPSKQERVDVADRVRELTRFELHNLLEPPPGGPFDLIFCRNVLVYFSPEAARIAVAHLVRALAPGGAILFGSMDVSEPPPGLVSAGQSELQIFCLPPPRRAEARRKSAPAPARFPTAPAVPRVPRVPPPEPVALHLRALVHIERGDKKFAEKALAELTRLVPDYVPGILERALLHVRTGERSAAAALMRDVLRRTDKLPADETLPGPEPLPVRFYRDSAETFLRSGRGGLE